MQKTIIHTFEITDIPFGSGVYQPRNEPASVELLEIETRDFGIMTELLMSQTRLGNDIIPIGSKIISRSHYLVKNITQNYNGRLDIIGVQMQNDTVKFFATSEIPLHHGDVLGFEYLSNFEPADQMRFH